MKDTPLHAASAGDSLEIVKYLVEKGADVNAEDKFQETPFDIASDYKNQEIANYLVEIGLNVDASKRV